MRTGPRHVLLTADAVGGVWTYALDLAHGLKRTGVEATVAVIGPPAGGRRRAEAKRLGVPVVDTGFPLDWWGVGADEIGRTGQALADFAEGLGCDLVHLHAPSLAAEGVFDMPVVGSAHSCLASWWAAVKGGDMPADFRWRTELLARGYAACDAVIAPSRSFAEETAARYAVETTAVWNGRRPLTDVDPWERPLGVLTSGRLWDAGKNLATLDAAAALMRAPVAAAGALEGPHGERVTPAHVEPLGHLDAQSLADRLTQTGVFASLSLYEPFGLGVLEAAQAGCALVLSDIPTFRELWSGAAVFVPARSPQAAADAVEAVLAAPIERDILGRKARARAERYAVDAMVSGTRAVYARVMTERRVPREAAA